MKRDAKIYNIIREYAGEEIVIDREALKEEQKKLKKQLQALTEPIRPSRAQRRRAKRERKK